MAITAAIIAMGHQLNLEIVAEGVESREQLEFLRFHGCEIAPGYLISRPVTADELHLLLLETTTENGEKRWASGSRGARILQLRKATSRRQLIQPKTHAGELKLAMTGQCHSPPGALHNRSPAFGLGVLNRVRSPVATQATNSTSRKPTFVI